MAAGKEVVAWGKGNTAACATISLLILAQAEVQRAEPREPLGGGRRKVEGGGEALSRACLHYLSLTRARTMLLVVPTTTTNSCEQMTGCKQGDGRWQQVRCTIGAGKQGQNAGCPNVAHEKQNYGEEEEEKRSFVAGMLEASVWDARVDCTVVESVRGDN